jgi:hypothetical protein
MMMVNIGADLKLGEGVGTYGRLHPMERDTELRGTLLSTLRIHVLECGRPFC